MNAVKLFIIVIATTFVCGCQLAPPVQSAWDKSTKDVFPRYTQPGSKAFYEQLIRGKTTRAEVYNLLGPPTSISFSSQRTGGFHSGTRPELPAGTDQVWSYHASKARHTFALDPRAPRFHVVTGTVLFDYQGYLLDYRIDDRVR